jgi:divalent metal cation (Fe/Co/Zn/Cd) transporter
VLVWVVYALGALAVAVVVLSAALAAVVYYSSDEEVAFGIDVSKPALAVWGAIIALAATTWFFRRRRIGR